MTIRGTTAENKSAQWLAQVADLLGAEASGMLTIHSDGSQSLVTQSHTDSAISEYRDYYGRMDPLTSLLAARPAGRALVIDTSTHPAYVAQRELSEDYLRPHGIDYVIASQWLEPDGTLRLVGVQRFRGAAPFLASQAAELDNHIRHWRIGNALPPQRAFDERGENFYLGCDIAAQLTLPVVVVDSQLAVIWANLAAREERSAVWVALLKHSTKSISELAIRRQVLELVLTCLRQNHKVETLLATAGSRWFATATPLSGKPGFAMMRFVAMDQLGQGIRGQLERLFGLTRAEAEMTVRLAQGESPEAIAVARGVSVDTVRTQLRTVFRKTETHRQAELVCAVVRLASG